MSYFDTNSWYAISDAPDGAFNTTLFAGGGGSHAVYVTTANASDYTSWWQVFPVQGSASVFTLRTRAGGPENCLDVNYNSAEVDPSHTQPALEPVNPELLSQQWTIQAWAGNGSGTTSYQIQNVGNGSSYNLDDHPGNPLFLSSNTTVNPSNSWYFSSIAPVNNASFSANPALISPPAAATTVVVTMPNITPVPTTPNTIFPYNAYTSGAYGGSPTSVSVAPTPQAASPTPSSSNNGVDIGVPVGVVLGVALLAALFGFWWFRRRRRNRRQAARSSSLPPYSAPFTQMTPVEAPTEYKPAAELDGSSGAVEMATPNNYKPQSSSLL